MPSPNGSIANLFVARKSLRTTQLGIRLFCSVSRGRNDRVGEAASKIKSRRLKKAPAAARHGTLPRVRGKERSLDYFWVFA
jgi:hypothetical protein